MAQFVGRAIEVTLAQPPGVLVQGVVANIIEQTSTLILQDVYFPGDGRRLPTCGIEGSQIADIKVLSPPAPPQQQVQHAPPQQASVPLPYTSQGGSNAPTPRAPQQPFMDPAIMSMGKRPPMPQAQVARPPVVSLEAPSTPLKMAASAPPPANVSPFIGEPRHASPASNPKKKRNDPATLAAPFSGLNISENVEPVGAEDTDEPTVVDGGVRRVSVTKTRTGKPMDAPVERQKKPRKPKGKRQQQVSQDMALPEPSPEVLRKQQPNEQFRGKGWRQTPILQELNDSPTRIPDGVDGQQSARAERKKSRKQKELEKEERRNGWATEDATDVQELPEFDFAANLTKFDKRSVFDQIRNEDTTADEERLVSFNRLPARPGTYGGKNLHPTENVLDGSVKGAKGGSEEDDTEEEFDFDSGRNSRRAMSRASTKRAPFRSNSNLAEDSPAAGVSSSHSALPARSRARAALNVPAAGHSSHSHGSPNPNTARFTPPTSPTIDRVGSFSANLGSFKLGNSTRKCPYITPGGMGAVEETAEVEFGISSSVISETAGRGIADVTLNAINSGGRRLARENVALNGRPVALVLVGNHKAGARAVIAARHLIGRGVRIIVCVLGYERMATSSELDRELRQQLEILKKLGGSVRGWPDVGRWLERPSTPAIEAVVDALLLAGGKILDGLAPEDQRTAIEMISWTNASTGRLVISVDAPSGMNGSTGEFHHDTATSTHIVIHAKHVVCLGAPRIGLLRALQRVAAGTVTDVRLDALYWVVDVGVNKAWKHFGAPGGKVVSFGPDWIVPIRFDDGIE